MDSPRKKCNYKTNIKNEAIPANSSIILRKTLAEGFHCKKVEIALLYKNNTFYLETYKNNVHVKIIDAQEHNLNDNNDYSLSFLNSLEPAKMQYSKDSNIDIIQHIVNFSEFIKSVDYLKDIRLPLILVLANIPELENAYWNGSYLVFGNGNILSPRQTCPFTSALIIAHEISHILLQNLLMYRGHAGALNESYADIIGLNYEDYYFEKFQSIGYLIGSELYQSYALRSMENPHKYAQAKDLYDQYYKNPYLETDHGYVHINSGIPNHCYYQMSKKITRKRAFNVFIDILTKLRYNATIQDFLELYQRADEDIDRSIIY